jgi:hypothetical protein
MHESLEAMPMSNTRAFARHGRLVLQCGAAAVWLAAVGLTGLPAVVLADSASAAAGEEKVAGEVLVILAKAEPGEVDPRLARMQALRKPPFEGYKSMRLLSTAQVVLSSKEPTYAELPKGRKLTLKLLGHTPDGRHRVEVSIDQPGKRSYLPLLTVLASQLPFFVAGQHYQGGTLIIGVRVTH